jgi:hypothetical protein
MVVLSLNLTFWGQKGYSVTCGIKTSCAIDLDCEWLLGSVCYNVGGLQAWAPAPCGVQSDYSPLEDQCGRKFVGTLTVCVIPAGGCGGNQAWLNPECYQ